MSWRAPVGLPALLLGTAAFLAGCGSVERDALGPVAPWGEQPEVLAAGLDQPGELVVAASSLWIAEEGTGRVLLLPLTGGEPTVALDGLDGPRYLATDGSAVAVADPAGGEVWLLDEGGEGTLLAQSGAPERIEWNGQELFWIDRPEGGAASLWSAELSSSEPSAIASDLDNPGGLAVGDGLVLVADRASGAGVRAFDRISGASSTLVVPEDPPQDLVLSDGGVFATTRTEAWPGGGWVRSIDADTGAITELSYSPPELGRIKADSDRLWWVTKDGLASAPIDGGTYRIEAARTRVGGFVLTENALLWTDSHRGEVLSLPRN